MQIPINRIIAIMKLLETEYGREYEDDEVREIGQNLVDYFKVLIKMDQENERETLQCKYAKQG